MKSQLIGVTIAVLLATSSWALTATDSGGGGASVSDYTAGWTGFYNKFHGYDSTPKKYRLDEINCEPGKGCDGPFIVWGMRDGMSRDLYANDLVNGFSFGSGVEHVDRSGDNGILVMPPDAVLDPSVQAAKDACLKQCDENRRAMEDHNTIEYGKLKAQYTTNKWMGTMLGAAIGAALPPGMAKVPGALAGGSLAYLIGKEYYSDLLDAFDLTSKAVIINAYYNCRRNICKVPTP